MPTYRQIWPIYAKQWDDAKLTRPKETTSIARRLVASKTRYSAVEHVTGVPWALIAVAHEREASQDWNASLAQGDPWRRVSVHKPAGRGPFSSWEAAAIDALQLDGLTLVKDWRLEKVLYYLTLYNGWGYWNYHNKMPSPYVWGATSVQVKGKYIRDGVFDETVMDTQQGCAALLKAMIELDPSIKFQRED